MNPFVELHQDQIGGVISCFGRVVITCTLPDICQWLGISKAKGSGLEMRISRTVLI